MARIVSFEGSSTGEQGGIVAESTVDDDPFCFDFQVETGGIYGGAGVYGIAQRIYIEGQTEGQDLEVSLLLDNEVISVGTVSLPVGARRVMELAVQRAGWISGVRITGGSLLTDPAPITSRIEISAIELDVYTAP